MEVWIVRHATAEDHPPEGGADFDRRLTDKGKRRFDEFAGWLVEQMGAPQIVVTSPLVRAVQTAELLCRAANLKKKDALVDDALAPGLNADRLLSLLKQHAAERIAVVGHQPDMGRTTAQLIGGGQLEFGKGHVACIELGSEPQIGAGELLWFIGPR